MQNELTTTIDWGRRRREVRALPETIHKAAMRVEQLVATRLGLVSEECLEVRNVPWRQGVIERTGGCQVGTWTFASTTNITETGPKADIYVLSYRNVWHKVETLEDVKQAVTA